MGCMVNEGTYYWAFGLANDIHGIFGMNGEVGGKPTSNTKHIYIYHRTERIWIGMGFCTFPIFNHCCG